MSENVVVLTNENFEAEVLKSDIPVLVDFWAPWCAPCKMIAPVIEALAEEFAGKMKVGKVNLDDYSELAQEYKIMSIPTVMVFKGGEIITKIVGARSKSEYIEELNNL